MEILVYGYSDIGGRSINEDSYAIKKDDTGVCVVVADGLGGHGMGKNASDIAVKRLSECFGMSDIPNKDDIISSMSKANEDIEKARANSYQMKTTAVCLYIRGNRTIWSHIGDSRLYHYYNCELADYTLDHSISQLAVALGEIERKNIPHHAERNKVLRVIGSDDLQPDFMNINLKSGFHAFLLCTDGFWEYLNEDEILMDLHKSSTPQDWINGLRCRICGRIDGENDNNTAAAVFVKI